MEVANKANITTKTAVIVFIVIFDIVLISSLFDVDVLFVRSIQERKRKEKKRTKEEKKRRRTEKNQRKGKRVVIYSFLRCRSEEREERKR